IADGDGRRRAPGHQVNRWKKCPRARSCKHPDAHTWVVAVCDYQVKIAISVQVTGGYPIWPEADDNVGQRGKRSGADDEQDGDARRPRVATGHRQIQDAVTVIVSDGDAACRLRKRVFGSVERPDS